MSFDRDQRTEQPTAERRRKAREAGKVAVSRDLVTSLSLLVLLLCASSVPLTTLEPVKDSFREQLRSAVSTRGFDAEASASLVSDAGFRAFGVLLPVVGLVAFLVVSVTVLQTGWMFRPLAVAPDPGRLIGAGGEGIRSPRAWGRGGFALLKCTWIGVAIWWGVAACLDGTTGVSAAALFSASPEVAVHGALGHLVDVAFVAATGLVVLGLADWLFQRWQLTHDLMMTREEVREELAEQEMSRDMRRRQRRLARRLAANARIQDDGGVP